MTDITLATIEWSRAQFALTAMYHWLFVPLTLGLGFILAFMETIYVKTGDPEWKRITQFWMTLFGINFAIGVATGIILEFQFGTNWSNYSWFVGDIFGAPLAIEGIFAFFLESTFIAVMFFGWNKVSKKFHLLSTWLVAFGANLSALWILVANAWMQKPVGMFFNPETARNEMQSFWDVVLSSMAVNKFLHTISSGFVLAAIFVVGVSAWFLLRKKEILFARRSILVASIFGLLSAIFVATTGDMSGFEVAKAQPMKLAAMEGLYEGESSAGLTAVGILTPCKKWNDSIDPYILQVKIPYMLSYLAKRDFNAYVPGIKDLIEGNAEAGLIPLDEKIRRGKIAINSLHDYKKHMEMGNPASANESKALLDSNFAFFGYGYLNSPEQIIPNVPIVFYSFRIMVILGFFFIAFFAVILFLLFKNKLLNHRWLLSLGVLSIPMAYIASMSGWIVAEMGRQPWVIQDLMPTMVAATRIDANAVQLTFWIFAFLFTTLLIAEISIMIKQIKIGPKSH